VYYSWIPDAHTRPIIHWIHHVLCLKQDSTHSHRRSLIDDNGFMASAQSSTEITSSCRKRFIKDEGVSFAHLNKMIQFFLELLQVAGGHLNISQSACFTVFHHWKGGGNMLLHTHDPHPTMTVIRPSSGELKEKSRTNPNEAHRAIGWMMTTDGKSTAQFIMLKAKAKLFAGGIRQTRIKDNMPQKCITYTILQALATHLQILIFPLPSVQPSRAPSSGPL
jgi:hypothetical protein